jgi:serine/threonine protein kinase/tetratricopeptide (TPR) repeat protein
VRDEESIFTEARGKGGAERAALLDRECGGRPGLRRDVEALLLADARAGQFLESSPRELAIGADAGPNPGALADSPELPERPGAVVGGYRLLEQIGEGGMGVVYLAEQQVMRRQVALKIIRLGLDSAQVIARFEAERQALALMDHPHIARVLDAGTTAGRLPYFVMEFVKGLPITRYCDENKLTTRERLELFVQVCHAVQHAHQKGVIHRDLKPTNILVTLHDGRHVPKVIDFGIAKATSDHLLTDRTLCTSAGQLVGTPPYMSPEQAESRGADVDTRSDVYSLGVLLYELLTGTTPFDKRRLGRAAFEEIRRILREEDPPRPSNRLGSLAGETQTSVAASQGTEPAKLGRMMRGDLDWIVLKAIEKDRSRRYATANALAMDVRRYLSHEPVLARPPGAVYRLGKLVRKYKVGVAAAGAVLGALLLGIVGTTAATIRAGRDRDAALRARADAQRQQRLAEDNHREVAEMARKAGAISDYLQGVLASANPWDAWRGEQPSRVSVRQMLDEAGEGLDAHALSGQPEVEATVRATLAAAYQGIGLPAEAMPHLKAALDLRRQLHGGKDHAEVARRMLALAETIAVLGRDGELPEGERLATEAVAMRRRLFGAEHEQVAAAQDVLSRVLRVRGNFRRAEQGAREALTLRRRLAGKGGADADVVRSQYNLALALGRGGSHAEAIPLLRDVLAADRRGLPREHPQIATDLYSLALQLECVGEDAEAAGYYEEALSIRREHLPEELADVSDVLRRLTVLLLAEGNYPRAEELLKGREGRLAGLIRSGRPSARLAATQAELWGQEAGLYARWGKPQPADAARAKLQEYFDGEIAALTERMRLNPAEKLACLERGALRLRAGRLAEAEADFADSIRIAPKLHGAWYYRAALLAYRGDLPGYAEHCRLMLDRFAQAKDRHIVEGTAKACLLLPHAAADHRLLTDLADRLLAYHEQSGDQRSLPWSRMLKGLAEYRRGDFAEALPWLEGSRTPEFVCLRPTSDLVRAMALYRLGRVAEAEAVLGDAARRIQRVVPAAGVGDLAEHGLVHWLPCQVLLREAKALIGSAPSAPSDPAGSEVVPEPPFEPHSAGGAPPAPRETGPPL